MTKAELRKIYREKRSLLTDKERNKLDDLLLIQFQKLRFPALQMLMSYCPSETHAEPNTWLFTRFLSHMMPGLKTCFPVTAADGDMKALAVTDETRFELSSFRVEEPVNGEPVEPQDIDLVFVPMLICDRRGYRVGFGKGYYDRFLAGCRPDVPKLAFSYFDPVELISDTHQFDIPLTVCITPGEVIEFG
ncbi:MAG TPA: 5-formyltetrahydrofolate cyclo-ligase [Chitinophagaceae bacterium]